MLYMARMLSDLTFRGRGRGSPLCLAKSTTQNNACHVTVTPATRCAIG